jgi:hypothetical protein
MNFAATYYTGIAFFMVYLFIHAMHAFFHEHKDRKGVSYLYALSITILLTIFTVTNKLI